jgi:hypothetical protein
MEHFNNKSSNKKNSPWSHRDHHQIDNRWTRTWLGLGNTRLARLFVIMLVVKGQRGGRKTPSYYMSVLHWAYCIHVYIIYCCVCVEGTIRWRLKITHADARTNVTRTRATHTHLAARLRLYLVSKMRADLVGQWSQILCNSHTQILKTHPHPHPFPLPHSYTVTVTATATPTPTPTHPHPHPRTDKSMKASRISYLSHSSKAYQMNHSSKARQTTHETTFSFNSSCETTNQRISKRPTKGYACRDEVRRLMTGEASEGYACRHEVRRRMTRSLSRLVCVNSSLYMPGHVQDWIKAYQTICTYVHAGIDIVHADIYMPITISYMPISLLYIPITISPISFSLACLSSMPQLLTSFSLACDSWMRQVLTWRGLAWHVSDMYKGNKGGGWQAYMTRSSLATLLKESRIDSFFCAWKKK